MKSTTQKLHHSDSRKLLSAFSIFLLLGGLASERSTSASELSVTTCFPLVYEDDSQHSKSLVCLPKDVQPGEIVSYRSKKTLNITVAKKLIEMKARCRNGKLVDARRREIRFFHPSCWGNPPPDYQEIRQREDKEVAQLKKHYAVIEFGCNPITQ
jgi:hypothetical protein